MTNPAREWKDRTRDERRIKHDARMLRLSQPPTQTMNADAIECPHCGFLATDDLYDYDTDDEWTCGHCEGTATLYCETSRWFTATPKQAPESTPEFDA
jgi:ribosomal protein S27AE